MRTAKKRNEKLGVEQLRAEIESLIIRYSEEADVTAYQIVGLLAHVQKSYLDLIDGMAPGDTGDE